MAGKSNAESEIDLVPILVGIIGHRDIPESDHPELESQLRAVFASLRKKYPHTPIAAVTALAEGADSIGARAAQAEGIGLIAPLPMPPEEYKKTFSTPERAAKLDTYLSKALPYVCVSHSGKPDSTDKQFARAGAAVIQYSHIVIALWNGEIIQREAGTSYLIKHALKGTPKDIVFDLEGSRPSPLDPIATAMVRQIPVRRECSPDPPKEADFPDAVEGKFGVLTFGRGNKPDLDLTPSQKRMFQHFDEFNKVIKKHRPQDASWIEAMVAQNKKASSPLIGKSTVDLPEGLHVLRERFAMADFLSHHFQTRRHWRITRYVIILAALIAFVHQIIGSLDLEEFPSIPGFITERAGEYAHFLEKWPFAVYGGLLLIAYSVVFYARYRRWQMRYLDYRTIAEGARIQFFWLIAGIRTPVVNFFLRKQRDELEWIRGVLRLWYLRAVLQGGVLENATPEQADLIEKEWIRERLEHSNKTANRSNFIDRTLSVLAIVFLLILFGGMVAKVLLPPGHEQTLKLIFVLATAGAGSLVLLVSSLRYFLGYREIHKSTSRMTVLFNDADHFYEPSDGIQDDERLILEELGREALTETGDWLLSNRNRKVNLPKPN